MNVNTKFVPEHTVSTIESEINRLNKRAKKLNIPGLSFIQTGNTELREITFYKTDGFTQTFLDKQNIQFVEVVISGQSPILAGWEFIAKIDHDRESGNIISKLVDDVELTQYREVGHVCNHCHVDRWRVKTYIVRNTETQETMQVGSSCVKDFTGHKNADAILNWFSFMETITNLDGFQGDSYYGSTEGWEFRISTEIFINVAAAVIARYGWMSKAASSDGNQSTSMIAMDLVNPTLASEQKAAKWIQENSNETSFKYAEYAMKEYVEHLEQKDFLNDFENNVLNLLLSETIKPKFAGFLAAGVNSAINHLGYETKKKQELQNKSNDYIGTEKERGIFNLTIVRTTGYASMYGDGIRVVMEDEKGNDVIWFTTSYPEIEVGQTYQVTATVKKHNAYNGRNQTIMNRCRFN